MLQAIEITRCSPNDVCCVCQITKEDFAFRHSYGKLNKTFQARSLPHACMNMAHAAATMLFAHPAAAQAVPPGAGHACKALLHAATVAALMSPFPCVPCKGGRRAGPRL